MCSTVTGPSNLRGARIDCPQQPKAPVLSPLPMTQCKASQVTTASAGVDATLCPAYLSSPVLLSLPRFSGWVSGLLDIVTGPGGLQVPGGRVPSPLRDSEPPEAAPHRDCALSCGHSCDRAIPGHFQSLWPIKEGTESGRPSTGLCRSPGSPPVPASLVLGPAHRCPWVHLQSGPREPLGSHLC